MDNEIVETKVSEATSIRYLQEQLKIQQEIFLQQQRDLLSKETLLSTINQTNNNSLSFTQGLIIGQLSVILVIGIFVKFFVFQDASNITSIVTSKDGTGVLIKRDKNNSNNNNNNSNNNSSENNKDKDNERFEDESSQVKISSILDKTYYDVQTHSPESLDWFNVLIAQFISQIRFEALNADNIFHSLNDYLSNLNFPNYLDSIKITEIDIGDDFPIFSNCRIVRDPNILSRLQAKIDVDLSDTITLGIETRLLINYPKPMTAALPIKLSVTLVRFSGCLSISLVNPNDSEFLPEGLHFKPSSPNTDDGISSTTSNIALMLSFSPDYRLEFTIKSLIGSRAKLEDVPKISALIESRLRQWFAERCVEPKYRIINLPSIWSATVSVKKESVENDSK